MDRSKLVKEWQRKSDYDSDPRRVVDMEAYAEVFGPASFRTPAASGSGETRTPMPELSVEPDVPDGYVPEEELGKMRRRLEQTAPSVGPATGVESSSRSSFDRLTDRLSGWLR